jgi:hypothetical protein
MQDFRVGEPALPVLLQDSSLYDTDQQSQDASNPCSNARKVGQPPVPARQQRLLQETCWTKHNQDADRTYSSASNAYA